MNHVWLILTYGSEKQYVDDVLVISVHPRECLLEIDKYFTMKPGSIEVPKLYLGGKISQAQRPNDIIAYAISMR